MQSFMFGSLAVDAVPFDASFEKADSDICASCGVAGPVERHHLVPVTYGGQNLPTVPLSGSCHGLVHGVEDRTKDIRSLILHGRLSIGRSRLMALEYERKAYETEEVLMRTLWAIGERTHELNEYHEEVYKAWQWILENPNDYSSDDGIPEKVSELRMAMRSDTHLRKEAEECRLQRDAYYHKLKERFPCWAEGLFEVEPIRPKRKTRYSTDPD